MYIDVFLSSHVPISCCSSKREPQKIYEIYAVLFPICVIATGVKLQFSVAV